MAEYFNNKYKGAMDTHFYVPHGQLGVPTSAQTANQIAEATARLNAGVKNIEVGAIKPDIFETIPKEHFKELNRLTKITGSKASLHAPIIDPSGFGEKGEWSEFQREQNEFQIKQVVDKANMLDPKGNIPVTIHSSSGIPGTFYTKITDEEIRELERSKKAGEFDQEELKRVDEILKTGQRVEMMMAVNQDTGQIQPLKREIKEHIRGRVEFIPEEEVNVINRTQWKDDILKISEFQNRVAEVEREMHTKMLQNYPFEQRIKAGEKLSENENRQFQNNMLEIQRINTYVRRLNEEVNLKLNSTHDKIVRFSDPKMLESLRKRGNLKEFDDLKKTYRQIENERSNLYHNAVDGKISIKDYHQGIEKLEKQSQTVNNQLTTVLSGLPPPDIWTPVDEFAPQKTAKTMSNVAFDAYKKFGDKSPILAIENMYPEWTMSRAKTLKKAIELSREEFSKKLIKEKGMSKKEAGAVAEKLIGATWDIGHINMARKFGLTKEDIIKETKEIAPHVKHFHLNDNFGAEHTELPAGAGIAPIKETIEELRKAGFKGRMIEEAGPYVAQFKQSPHPAFMENLNTPLYSVQAEPYWSQIRETYGNYFAGYGEILPQQHFKMYGSGFASLPQELGGEIGGDKSRFAGTPNE